jgi:sugar/nucleoside kinase (ribokinase family)
VPDSRFTAADRIVVFGDVIDDVVAIPRGPIRTDTDTPSSITVNAGGSGANTAAWLGAIGAPVDFVGRVGAADVERHSALLATAGVRPHLVGDPERPTGTIVIIVDGHRRTMLTERGANAAFDPDAVTDELLSGAALVHFTGHTLFGEHDRSDRAASIRRLIVRALARGVEVSVDPGSAGFLTDYGVPEFLAAVAGTGLLFPSLDEGRLLTGRDNPLEIAAELTSIFPVVALTLGIEGVVLAERGRAPDHLVAPVTEAIDPTGAGDAFCAGFLGAWVRTHDIEVAAAEAAELAAQAVTIVGGRPLS